MTARKSVEADRMARANAEMKFALAHNCTVLEARKRMNREWLDEFERAPDQLIGRVRRCGTADQPADDIPTTPIVPAEQPRPQFWWEKQ